MSRRARPAIETRESDSPEVREQIKKANAVLAQMNVPWGELFAAIESAEDGNVGAAAVQPDARSRTVLMGGEARDLPAVLAYMTRLERTRAAARCGAHEPRDQDQGAGTAGGLRSCARWVEAP